MSYLVYNFAGLEPRLLDFWACVSATSEKERRVKLSVIVRAIKVQSSLDFFKPI